jgi:ubiquinone/menaquinone biosynthesis C-methylase UbiE
MDWFHEHEPEVVEFFRSLFADHGVKTVLDCACGAGHELIIFKQLGSRPTGSDLSPAMLDLAKKNLTKAGVDLPLH